MANLIARIMHVHTIVYTIVFMSKMYLDFLNDRRLREDYYSICNPAILTSRYDECAVEDLTVAKPFLEQLIPEVVLGIIKFIVDLVLILSGIVYFLKFRSLKKRLDLAAANKKTKMMRIHIKQRMSFSRHLIDVIVLICFMGFATRIYLKDIFFLFLEIDHFYLKMCRCSDWVQKVYLDQALAFDIYDFLIAVFILGQILKHAEAMVKRNATKSGEYDSILENQRLFHDVNNSDHDTMVTSIDRSSM